MCCKVSKAKRQGSLAVILRYLVTLVNQVIFTVWCHVHILQFLLNLWSYLVGNKNTRFVSNIKRWNCMNNMLNYFTGSSTNTLVYLSKVKSLGNVWRINTKSLPYSGVADVSFLHTRWTQLTVRTFQHLK